MRKTKEIKQLLKEIEKTNKEYYRLEEQIRCYINMLKEKGVKQSDLYRWGYSTYDIDLNEPF